MSGSGSNVAGATGGTQGAGSIDAQSPEFLEASKMIPANTLKQSSGTDRLPTDGGGSSLTFEEATQMIPASTLKSLPVDGTAK